MGLSIAGDWLTGARPASGATNLALSNRRGRVWNIVLKKALRRSALARLEALLNLVDDVYATAAAHQLIVAMASTQRFQRVTDFHGLFQTIQPRFGRGCIQELPVICLIFQR